MIMGNVDTEAQRYVSATEVVTGNNSLEIIHFALNCRVFGFGIETAMVQRALLRLAQPLRRARIVATPVHLSCREVFAENRFAYDGDHCDGDHWISTGAAPELAPDWLTVTDTTGGAG